MLELQICAAMLTYGVPEPVWQLATGVLALALATVLLIQPWKEENL